MSIISKNKLVFMALAALLQHSLTHGAFARLQSFRPAVSAIAGLRAFNSKINADQVLRLWESRQKELDALGGIPEKVQTAAHIISRNESQISPAIHVMKRYGLYDVTAQNFKLATHSGVARIEIAPEIQGYMGESVRVELEKIVSGAAIEKVKITEYTKAATGNSNCFFRMGVYSVRGEVLIGRGFLQFLQGAKLEIPQDQRDNKVYSDLGKQMNLGIFSGVFLHELGHIHQQHGLMKKEITNNKITQENLVDLAIIGRYCEQEADAFVISYGNLQFAKGMISFLKSNLSEFSNTNEVFHNLIKQRIIKNFPNKNDEEKEEAIRFLLRNSHPSIEQRIVFFQCETARLMRQQQPQEEVKE